MGLFNRPTSADAPSGSSGQNQSNDIFSHSNSYGSILAEQERRRKAKAGKQNAKGEGKRKSDEGGFESSTEESKQTPKKRQSEESPKRRRISGQDVEGLLKKSGVSIDVDEAGEEETILMKSSSKESLRNERSNRRAARGNSGPTATRNKPTSEVIELGGSSDDETPMGGSTSHQRTKQPAFIEDDDESDEELAALARQARQRRLQANSNSGTPDAASKASPFQSGASHSPHTDRGIPPPHDPAVKILVSSRIADTNPLIVYRKLSQNLREIRLAYCKRQGFDEDLTQQIFFVHRLRRVYDVTTCRSLGLDTDASGNITMKGAEGKEGVDQVALEAVTEDIFNQMRDEKAREDAKRAGQWKSDAEEGEDDEKPAAKPTAGQLGLVLKAKDKPDFKLLVKPTTQFFRIVNAVRKNFHVADESSITLEFDGEPLDPDEQVQGTEIEDLDIVNVHIS